ncbi:MAG: hypothetical protein HY859_13325, partial [Caulobacterales bacterium]|nr:hypothetical protein [Caulobacterales bacterium]
MGPEGCGCPQPRPDHRTDVSHPEIRSRPREDLFPRRRGRRAGALPPAGADRRLTDPVATFELERPGLKRLAYRMLGSVSEAEDVVQDAWLRWDRAGGEADNPQAWLVQATTRLCLDRLKSARARRETYVGPWLPEPLIEAVTDDPVERAEDVSVAFLLALERLSPLERAVFLL